jgi:hypothetical protein
MNLVQVRVADTEFEGKSHPTWSDTEFGPECVLQELASCYGKQYRLVEVLGPSADVAQERDDALFALQALCEEVNAVLMGYTYTLADCIKGAVDMRERASKKEEPYQARAEPAPDISDVIQSGWAANGEKL